MISHNGLQNQEFYRKLRHRRDILTQEASIDMSEAQLLRQELEQFLLATRSRCDPETGEPLVSFPDSFDEISSVMDRSDLEGRDNWSASLFQQAFSSEAFTDATGRYKSILGGASEEERVTRGLARIDMLDRKLSLLGKQAAALDSGDQEQGDSENEDEISPTSSPMTSRSDMSSALFLTRLTNLRDGRVVEDHSDNYAEYVSADDHEYDDPHGTLSARNKVTPSMNKRKKSNKKEQLFSLPRSESDKMRAETLISPDFEESSAWQDIVRYGYSEREEGRLDEIDRQLEELARLDFTSSTSKSDALWTKGNFSQPLGTVDGIYNDPNCDSADEEQRQYSPSSSSSRPISSRPSSTLRGVVSSSPSRRPLHASRPLSNTTTLSNRSKTTNKTSENRSIVVDKAGKDIKTECTAPPGENESGLGTNVNILAARRLERVRKQYLETLDEALRRFSEDDTAAQSNGILCDLELLAEVDPMNLDDEDRVEICSPQSEAMKTHPTSAASHRSRGSHRSSVSAASIAQQAYYDLQRTIRNTVDGYRAAAEDSPQSISLAPEAERRQLLDSIRLDVERLSIMREQLRSSGLSRDPTQAFSRHSHVEDDDKDQCAASTEYSVVGSNLVEQTSYFGLDDTYLDKGFGQGTNRESKINFKFTDEADSASTVSVPIPTASPVLREIRGEEYSVGIISSSVPFLPSIVNARRDHVTSSISRSHSNDLDPNLLGEQQHTTGIIDLGSGTIAAKKVLRI